MWCRAMCFAMALCRGLLRCAVWCVVVWCGVVRRNKLSLDVVRCSMVLRDAVLCCGVRVEHIKWLVGWI